MSLHRIFDDKHERRIATGILETLDCIANGNIKQVFCKTEEGAFLRTDLDVSQKKGLTVIYGGPSKGIMNTLIDVGAIKVDTAPIDMKNGLGKGYVLTRAPR